MNRTNLIFNPFKSRQSVILLFFLSMWTSTVFAQYKSLVRVATRDNMLLLGVDSEGKLRQIRYGQTISDLDLENLKTEGAPEAFPAFGVNVSTAGLKVVHFDGNTTCDLKVVGTEQTQLDANTSLTKITLKDSYYAFQTVLYYKAFSKENIIEQWVEILNNEKGKVMLSEAASCNLAISQSSYFLTYFNGDWMNEFNIYQNQLKPGTMVLDSKEGVRTAQKTSPSFLLSMNKKLEEESGDVLGATLAWPGNWQIQFNVDQAQQLRIIAGINPYGAAYALKSGKNFKTPSLLYTFSNSGSGEVTRRFHRWARNYGMHNGLGDRDMVLNNWETTGMDFTEAKLAELMQQGGSLGFDRFLLDDGWFGNEFPRNDDHAGLGDWQVNKKKLPGGLSSLIAVSKENKLRFGLWVEPEMVNPKSRLYTDHPDWALSAPHRPLDLQRNQLILDLCNPKVQDYLVSTLNKLVAENPGLDYLKWDCNRFLTNAWSNYLSSGEQSNLYLDYARGYLEVLRRFRQKNPDVTLMLCASGGGRMDFGSLAYFDEYWPSDNSNAHDRVRIQWGMNYFFPSIGFAAHVSEMGRETSLKFRFDVAMAGKLGIDMQLSHLNAQDKSFAKKSIATYREVKDIVLHGDLYRLLSPYEYDRTAMMYVSENKQRALMFAFQMQKGNGGDFTPIYLRGLDPAGKYKLSELNKGSYSRVEEFEGKVFTGKYLMEQGLRFSMWNIDESSILLLTKQ